MKTKNINIRIEDYTEAELDCLCRWLGLNKTEVITGLISWAYTAGDLASNGNTQEIKTYYHTIFSHIYRDLNEIDDDNPVFM